MNSTITTILERRTIRALKYTDVSDDHINLMLECMQAAPNAGNVEPWFFVVIKNQNLKNKLCQLSFDQKAIENGGVLFVICSDPSISKAKYGEIGETLFCLQDTAAAVQNLLLVSHSLGYGAVWIGTIHQKEIAITLELPTNLIPVAIVAVGKIDMEIPKKERKSLNQLVKFIN